MVKSNKIYICCYKNLPERLDKIKSLFKTREVVLVLQNGDTSYDNEILPNNFSKIVVNAANLSQKREEIRKMNIGKKYWVFDDDLKFIFDSVNHKRVDPEKVIEEVENELDQIKDWTIFSFSGEITCFNRRQKKLNELNGKTYLYKCKSGCSNFYYSERFSVPFLENRYYREDKYVYAFSDNCYTSLKYSAEFSKAKITNTKTTTIWTNAEVWKYYAIGNIILSENKLICQKKKRENALDYAFNKYNNTNQINFLYKAIVLENKSFDEFFSDFFDLCINHKKCKLDQEIDYDKLKKWFNDFEKTMEK